MRLGRSNCYISSGNPASTVASLYRPLSPLTPKKKRPRLFFLSLHVFLYEFHGPITISLPYEVRQRAVFINVVALVGRHPVVEFYDVKIEPFRYDRQ